MTPAWGSALKAAATRNCGVSEIAVALDVAGRACRHVECLRHVVAWNAPEPQSLLAALEKIDIIAAHIRGL